jgi:hypothetical protein
MNALARIFGSTATAMTPASIKKKIKTLVEKETNVQKLDLVLSLLTESTSEVAEPAVPYSSVGKGKGGIRSNSDRGGLKDAVAASERQFAEGEGIPLDQFEAEMDAMLDEIFMDDPNGRAEVPTRTSPSRSKRKRL